MLKVTKTINLVLIGFLFFPTVNAAWVEYIDPEDYYNRGYTLGSVSRCSQASSSELTTARNRMSHKIKIASSDSIGQENVVDRSIAIKLQQVFDDGYSRGVAEAKALSRSERRSYCSEYYNEIVDWAIGLSNPEQLLKEFGGNYQTVISREEYERKQAKQFETSSPQPSQKQPIGSGEYSGEWAFYGSCPTHLSNQFRGRLTFTLRNRKDGRFFYRSSLLEGDIGDNIFEFVHDPAGQKNSFSIYGLDGISSFFTISVGAGSDSFKVHDRDCSVRFFRIKY